MLRLRTLSVALLCIASRSQAQCSAAPPARRLSTDGSSRTESARLGDLVGSCVSDRSLIRSSASTPPQIDDGFVLLDPVLSSQWNSRIPESMNDGPVWAGRGLTIAASAGFRVGSGRVDVLAAPVIFSAQNQPFPLLASGRSNGSPFASPFHAGTVSADLPLRFGNSRYTRIDPGESHIQVSLGRSIVGVSTESQWWGPGIRNALILSDNAAGIPRVFARTARPIATRLGDVAGYWFTGGLMESPYFDYDGRNDLRSASGAVVTLRLRADTGLTIGAARMVVAGTRLSRIISRVGDVFFDWSRAPSSGPITRRSDQMYSLFGRWVIPDAGLSTHVEWATLDLPTSLRSILVAPQKGQGFTVGLEWANRMDSGTTLRIQTEFTTLEQTPRTAGGVLPEFYASYTVPQGFTQQGQALGAAIGPGSSSQYFGVDLFRSRVSYSLSAGRIRWEDGAFYRAYPGGLAHFAHDVSVFFGAGLRWDSKPMAVETTAIKTLRMNYLFQTINPFGPGTEHDVRNATLRIKLTPHLARP